MNSLEKTGDIFQSGTFGLKCVLVVSKSNLNKFNESNKQ
jgi:hypothetical protein